MLALSVGVREAARQLGLNEKRVLAWSMREGWLKPQQRPPAQADVVTVVKPSVALAEAIAENGRESKHKLSIAARRASEVFAKMPGGRVIFNSKEFKDITSATGQIHGWNESQGQAQFSLNVLNLGGSVQIGVRSSASEDEQTPTGTEQS